MASKRRTGLNGGSSTRTRQGRAGISRPKKSASKKLYKAAPTRTRTSLVGMTIYQPDLKPSPVGQKLLEALER